MIEVSFFNFDQNGRAQAGVLFEGSYYPLKGDGDIVDLADDFSNFDINLIDKENKLDPDLLNFYCPVINPSKVICVGLNYEDHVKELSRESLGHPTFFSRFNHSFVAHKKIIPLVDISDKYDYEVELALIIGKKAHQIAKDKALDYICGYSIFNDVTVRDYQVRTSQWFMGKNFYQTGSFGPFLVPAACLPRNADGLVMQTKVNDVILQSGNSSNMIFKPDELVYELAQIMPLEKGDVIITGTPGGVAVSRSPRTYINDGDTCFLSIEKLGILENKFLKTAKK